MSQKISELKHERAKYIKQARDVVEKAEKESRDLSSEEEQKYNSIIDEAEKVKTKIDREESLQSIEKELEEPEPTKAANAEPEPEEREGPFASKEYKEAFRTFLSHGASAVTEKQMSVIKKEYKALQMDLDVSGGYLVTPQEMIQDLIQKVDDMVFMRQLGSTFTVMNAASLGAPSLDSDPDDAEWTSELATGSEDTAMKFGKRELNPHPLAKRIKISNKLLRASFLNPEELVNQRLAYKFGVTEEKAFLTGTGANQPLGVFTATSNGISTSRDVSEDNTATLIKADNLINVKYTLKSQYWPRARWLFHRDAVKQLMKLKDGEGQYLLRESLRAGEPDMLLGNPMVVSEYVPNTFTTGKYVGMFADFSFYWIVDALNMTVQRLVELYAETNQLGLIGRKETDGMPVLEEAFVRIKLG